jgi:hypothetical protein
LTGATNNAILIKKGGAVGLIKKTLAIVLVVISALNFLYSAAVTAISAAVYYASFAAPAAVAFLIPDIFSTAGILAVSFPFTAQKTGRAAFLLGLASVALVICSAVIIFKLT